MRSVVDSGERTYSPADTQDLSSDFEEASFRGVRKLLHKNEWLARVYFPSGRRVTVGRFPSAAEAATAYDREVQNLFGEDAAGKTNFPEGVEFSGKHVAASSTAKGSSGLAPAVKLPSPEPKRVTQSSAKFRGVHFFRPTRMWQARFSQDNQTLCLGNFFSEMEAARAFDKKAVRCQGPRARTNFQVEDYPEELRLWREENGGAEAELPVSCGEEGEEEEEECSAADPRAAAAAASPAGSRAPTDLRREGAGGSGSAAAEPSLAGRRQGEPQASRADGGMSAHWGATARSPDSQQTDLWRQIGTSLAIEACREASSETLGGSITLSPQRTPRRPRPRKRAGTPVSAPQPKRPKGGARPAPPAAPRGAAAPAPSSRLRSGALLKPPGSRSEAAAGKPQGRAAKRPLAPGKSIAERVRRSAWAAPSRVRNAATRTLTDIARAKAASARMHLSPATPAKAERAADAKGKAGQVTRAAKPAPGEAVSDKRELTLYKLLEADIPGSIPPPKDRPRRGVSQYRGVTRQHSRWKAQLVYSHHVYHIGLFETEVEAAKAFDQVIVRIWGRQVKHLSNFNIDNYKKQLREHRNRQIATAGIRRQPARRAAMEIKP